MRILVPALTAALFFGMTAAAPQPAAAQSCPHSVKCITYNGTLEVDVTISIQSKNIFVSSPGAGGAKIVCSADFVASFADRKDKSVTINIEETANARATVGNGGRAAVAEPQSETYETLTCQVLIPYSWSLPDSHADADGTLKLTGSLSVVAYSVNTMTGVETTLRTNGQSIYVSTFPDPKAGPVPTRFAIKVTL